MTIEVKNVKDGFPKKCYDTISSFSNKYGGIIIFGIDEENAFRVILKNNNDNTMQISEQVTEQVKKQVYSKIGNYMHFKGLGVKYE